MKKTRSLLLSMASLFMAGGLILAACAPAATPAPTAAPTQPPAPTAVPATTAPKGVIAVEDGASIVFSGWGDETEQKIYKDSIVRFNAVYPGVKVDFQPIPTDFQTKLKAAMAGGTAPDVFYVDSELMTAFQPSGQLLALDPFMAEAGTSRADFIPSLLTIFSSGDKTFALPKDWGTLGLVYLPEAFTDAGVAEPTADWTWADLKTAAEKIKAAGKFGGFCMGADWARFAPFAFGAGGAYASDDFKTATLNTPEIKTAAQAVADLKASGALATPGDLSAGWCGEAIGKKLAAMTFEGGWMVNFMRTTYADVVWKAVPLPTGPKGKADVIFTNGIGVNAASKYPKASAALALFLTGHDNQGEIVKTGFAYSTHPDQLGLVVDPNDAAIAQGGTFPLTRVAYWGPNTNKVNDAVSKAFERIFLGDQTVDESLAQAQTDAQAALDGK